MWVCQVFGDMAEHTIYDITVGDFKTAGIRSNSRAANSEDLLGNMPSGS